jgi:hypothetical protein
LNILLETSELYFLQCLSTGGLTGIKKHQANLEIHTLNDLKKISKLSLSTVEEIVEDCLERSKTKYTSLEVIGAKLWSFNHQK